jgi:hypothetical protein
VTKIPARQLHRFTRAIARASTFINNTSPVSSPWAKSFYQDPSQGGRRGADRIDIEVWAGTAFVP